MALAFHEPNGRIAQVAGQFSGKCTELVAAGPVSRILSAARMLRDDHSSGTRIAARLKRPTRRFNAPSRYVRSRSRASFLFGLAPCGVCPARGIAAAAVRSYRTFSPLPVPPKTHRRFVFCGTFRRAIPTVQAWGPSRTLSGTLLCGVRTFLPPRRATVRSSCQLVHYKRCHCQFVVGL